MKVPMETRFWKNNVDVAVAEEARRQMEEEMELTKIINGFELDLVNGKRTQSEINTWLLNNNGQLEAVSSLNQYYYKIVLHYHSGTHASHRNYLKNKPLP